MLKFCRFFILILILEFVSTQQVFCADRYYWLCSDDNVTISLDTATFKTTRSKDNIWIYYDTWNKWEYSEAGVQQYINVYRKDLPVEGYEKFNASLFHIKFAWNLVTDQRMYKIIAKIDYDIDGNVLDNFVSDSSIKYEPVVPDTAAESIFFKIIEYCVEYKIYPPA